MKKRVLLPISGFESASRLKGSALSSVPPPKTAGPPPLRGASGRSPSQPINPKIGGRIQKRQGPKRGRRLVLGILGGMGPEATVRFFDLVVRSTAAGRDQDHIPILVWNDPRVPDRTAAVLGKGESPVPLLRAGAAALVKAGADIIVIPCVTAHYFFPGIAAGRRSKFLNLLDETRTHLRKNLPRIRKIGVLATTGTIRSGIIESTFGRIGVEVVVPDEKDQLKVMDAIYGRRGIKAGGPWDFSRKVLAGVARRLVRRGARAILAGCTEIPLVLSGKDLPVPLIDPMAVGARACVKRAGFAPRANVRRKG